MNLVDWCFEKHSCLIIYSFLWFVSCAMKRNGTNEMAFVNWWLDCFAGEDFTSLAFLLSFSWSGHSKSLWYVILWTNLSLFGYFNPSVLHLSRQASPGYLDFTWLHSFGLTGTFFFFFQCSYFMFSLLVWLYPCFPYSFVCVCIDFRSSFWVLCGLMSCAGGLNDLI